ncbi:MULTISPECIES: BapA/Bap/LapF family large adhesin [unclassified Acinetobacter]|uniref:BapA/Bap/LapF family large adhesin n=3 Tax=Acinetobacter TaxID=469 RepID=UPI0015D10290|nr:MULTISPECIES: BapA/Bap/LapF family large adhesin [unclassified Acinetobacter]UUS56824.1 Ig-like domain-containing protein [Acinetobacter sp. YH16040_T]
MPQISVISKESHKVLDQVESNQIGLIENSVIVVKIRKEDVASITKNGADAIITLKNGEVITVQNYFSEATPDNSLVFEDEDGTLYWAKFTTVNGDIADVIQYQPLDEIEPLLYNDSLTGVILPWITGAAGAGLLGAAIGGGSDSSGGSKDTTKPEAPKDVVITDDGEHVTGKGEPGTTVEVKDQDGKVIGAGTVDSSGNFGVELKDPLTNGETVEVTVTDKAGNESEPTEATAKDTTKPDAPNATLNEDGTAVTGKTEPGAKVEVRDENGKLIGSGTANSLGEFEIPVSPAVTDGETAKVTAKDVAGNTSDPTTVTGGKDTTKPDAPNATLNEDGTVVTGKTEPGAKVEVRDENGKLIGSGTANSLGEFEISVSPAVSDGETAKVTAKDAAGNTSDPTTVTGGKDTTKPYAPKDVVITDDGEHVTGKGEPGTTVEVKDQDGKVIGTGTVDSSGNFDVELKDPLTNGETVDVTVTDKAGNKSEPTEATAKDTTKPDAPKDVVITDDGEHVTGKGEPGTAVEVKDQDGKVIGTGTVDSSGNFDVELKDPLTNGETVDVTVTDKADNESEPTEATAKDSTKPDAPNATLNEDGTVVTGKTEPGAKVEVRDENGKLIGSGTANSLGEFEIPISPAVTDGETAQVTAKDAAGNTSDPTTVIGVKDTINPEISIEDTTLTQDSMPSFKGKTEAGTAVSVVIRDSKGEIVNQGKAEVIGDQWSYRADKTLIDGEYSVEAIATDAAGNTGRATDTSFTIDATAPIVTIDDFKEPNFTGTVNEDANLQVQVQDSNGKDIAGTTTVKDGAWTFIPDSPVAEADYTVTVTATDAAGNQQTAIGTVNTTLPTVDIDDLFGTSNFAAAFSRVSTLSVPANVPQTNQTKPTFSGTSTKSVEVTVYLRDANNKVIDSGLAKLDTATGKWTYTPANELLEGYYVLEAVSKDAAGNISSPASKTFVIDITDPVIEIQNAVLTNDVTPDVKGKTEIGSTVMVTVKTPNGDVIETGTATVDAKGDWSYSVKANLTDGGYQVTANAKDKAGNISDDVKTQVTVDSSAPKATITIADNGDVKISFSEKVVGFDADDVQVTGGKLKDLAQQADGSWTAKVVANGTDGSAATVKLDIASGSYSDAAGNAGQAATASHSVASVDSTAPKATITIADNGDVKISFSEKVVGFDADDVQVSGGKLKELAQQADGSWTAKVVANGTDGSAATVKLDIAAGSYSDAAGNAGQAATASHSVASIDSTAPTATISIADNGDVKISFSEKVVGFDADDVEVTGGKLTDLAQQADGSWIGKVVANGTDGSAATVKLDIAAGSYSDAAGNAGQAATASHSVASIDSTAPTATISIADNGDVKISFSEKVIGFDADDVQVTGGKLTDLAQQADGSWTAKVVANGNDGSTANVKLDIAAGSYSDAAGNAGQAATASHSVASVDTTAPTITIDDLIITNDQTPTISGETEPGASVYVYIKDSAGVVKFEGQASVFADGAWTFTPPRNLDDGEYTAVAIATDRVGNTAEANDGFEIDTTPPTVDIDDFDFFAAPAVAPLATFVMRATTLSTPSIPLTNNNKQTFSGTSSKSTEVLINIYDAENNLLDSGLAKLDTATGKWTYTPSVALPEGLLTLEAISKDIAGNISAPSTKQFIVDTIPPLIDIHDVGVITDPSPSFSGKTEKGVTVTVSVKDQLGNVVETGQALVDAQGNWSYQSKSHLANGLYHIEAIAKDAAGNSSQKVATSTTIDSTAEVSIAVQANADGSATVTGKTEPGASVEITTPDGQTYPATVDANGQFTATISSPAAEGTYTATATDQAGNQGSASADLDDQVAPQIDDLEVDANADGSATVTGKTEPGASVEITTPDGQTYPASVDANGQFIATIPTPAAEGTYTATATDNAGNQGSATADLDDQVAPQIDDLEVDANADGSAPVTGKTEPGASVEITTPDGQTYPASVDANGHFTATIPSPAAEGTYTAIATDQAGNQGSATADLDDQVAPKIDDFKVTSNPDGSATITGKTESGAKVSITDPQGKDIDVSVDANDHFIAQIPATAAEGTYTATATDQAGNQGYASDDLMDATMPVIPTAEVNQKDGSTVFGIAQPGSEVTVYASDSKQKLGTAVADANGVYSVQLQPALVDGEQVNVTAKDAGGESPAITAQAPDLFAPDAPTAKVNATGSAVEGVTEAFAIVTVYGGSKGTTPLGTATADANGYYQIALVPALVDGEQVKVTAKDAGGESLATPALAPDLYAPATPFATLDSQGAVVTGHAEAGSDITVYAADAKTILGSAIADLEGNFKVVLQPAVTDGQHILVTAKDDGGESAPQELIAPTVSIHAADNLVNANINFEYPVEEVRTNKLFNVFDLINIGSKVHTGYFSIGDQEVGEATISVHTGSLINLFDKAEMRLFVKNADGSWKLIASNKDYGLLDFIGIFGEETAVRAKNLQSGEYKFEFVGGSAIGLATSVSANLSLKVFDTSVEPEVSHVEEAKGNVISDHDALYGQDAVPAGAIVNSINGQLINGTTTVKGNYGTLTIHQDGSYSYKPKADVTAIGKAEVFSYSVVDPVSGKASSADLIIHIGTQSDLALNWNAAEPKDHASTVVATNNVDMIGFDASNTVSTGQSNSISYSWSIGFGGTKAGSTKITVADGTVENIKVDFGSSQLVSLLGNTTINVYDEKGKLVATSGASTVVDVIGLLPNGNSVTVTGLKAGTYTIQAVTNKGISLGGSVSAVISRSIIDLDSFTVKFAANAATTGNLLTDNDGFGVDTVASKYTDLYVSKDGGLTFTQVSSTGTTITAKYGEMVVKSDGSYTYTLKDMNLASGAAEQFTYKLVAPNGDISAATLTIKAGVNFTGSVGNDEITSTAGNDQFTTKAGIDTVIYKVLDQADATGGNGHDTWNDFNASEGDKVNIKALLQGQNANQSNIDQFVSVKSDGKGNTVISIDRDGTGSKFGDKVELLTLKNTDVTLQDLIDHNQLLY